MSKKKAAKKKYFMSNKHKKQFFETIDWIPDEVKKQLKKEQLQIIEYPDKKIIAKKNTIYFIIKNEFVIPTITFVRSFSTNLKRITIDLPAIRYISNGADVMAPGIIEYPLNLEKGEIVIIDEERNKTPIAIGKALVSGDDLKKIKETTNKGKVIQNLHYLKDRYSDLLPRI